MSDSSLAENDLLMAEIRGRMARLVQGDRKATGPQITTRYNHSMVAAVCYSSRRPYSVPLLSARNRKLSVEFRQPDKHP